MPTDIQYRLIGTTEDQLLTRQPNRTALAMYNNHASQTLYISEKRGVSSTNGFPIPAGGGLTFKIPEDDPTGEIYIIADGADTDLRFIESFGIITQKALDKAVFQLFNQGD